MSKLIHNTCTQLGLRSVEQEKNGNNQNNLLTPSTLVLKEEIMCKIFYRVEMIC